MQEGDQKLGSAWQRHTHRIIIASYDLFQKLPGDVLDSCKTIIADEAHALKSRDAKRTIVGNPMVIMHCRLLFAQYELWAAPCGIQATGSCLVSAGDDWTAHAGQYI